MSGKTPLGSPWDCALRYLGQRSHSQLEIEQKLGRRGFPAEEIAETIARMEQADLIDDEQFARDYVRSILSGKGVSLREITRRLRQRGVEQAVIERALAGHSQDEDFARACAAAERRLGQMLGLEEAVQRRRLLAYLARRGFSEGVCYAAVGRAMSVLA